MNGRSPIAGEDRTIRARYDERTVRVYQAYRKEIGKHAVEHGAFGPGFSVNRMTWIKPSFNWMMHRSGFGRKPSQEFVLAIDITRDGFEWALRHGALASFDPRFHASEEEWRAALQASPVRIQFDPARDWRLTRSQTERAIQIGLSGDAVRRYLDDWIVGFEDVTGIAHAIERCAQRGEDPPFRPDRLEATYPMPADSIGSALRAASETGDG